MPDRPATVIHVTAIVLAVTHDEPRVVVTWPDRRVPDAVPDANPPALDHGLPRLPAGPFDPARHRSLEAGMRFWLDAQTGLSPGYMEQLYTFGNQFRDPGELAGGPRLVSVAYLALAPEAPAAGAQRAEWRRVYEFLPWEDWRTGPPPSLASVIQPGLDRWTAAAADGAERRHRQERVSRCFGGPGIAGEMALERFELLYDAGLVAEAVRDQALIAPPHAVAPPAPAASSGGAGTVPPLLPGLGQPLARDDRRILAAAVGRIRGKLAYRPVVFELLPPEFTLSRLQGVVEALAGMRLHKQNFRRMVLAGSLVEDTGRIVTWGRGRPAALYRFHRDVLATRASVGIGLPLHRPPT